MYTIVNPQNPFSSLPDTNLIGNADQNLPALGAGAVGYLITLPVQRLVRYAMNALGFDRGGGDTDFAEAASTVLTIAGGMFASRAIQGQEARVAFQFGVIAGAATPLFTGALNWLRETFPMLAQGWDNPRRVSSMPSMAGTRFMRTATPTSAERVNRMGAGYSGRNPTSVPGQFSVLQGDNPKYLPKQ